MPASTTRLSVLGWAALRTSTRQKRPQGVRKGAAGKFPRTASPIAASQRVAFKSSFPQRVGKAVEPLTSEEKTSQSPEAGSEKTLRTEGTTGKEDKSAAGQKVEHTQFKAVEGQPERAECTVKSIVTTEDQGHTIYTGHDLKPHASSKGGTASTEPGVDSTAENPGSLPTAGPLDEVLHRAPPAVKARQHPHMSPPPYVHHFDSYSLVKTLQGGGYSQKQAIESMKGIRALLAQNLIVAQQSLVSKSDVENETYLFRAACSELGQEIRNNRRLRDEQIRQQRTHLQHEVDILTQTLNQEASTLSDNVRGMFNDRRMAVREEQKTADSAVQQINYKISTMLVSDSKSEIEGVRWILIRRSALGIFFMAILTLGTVRYATYLVNERQREVERKKEERELLRRDAGRIDNSEAADAAAILAAN